jgi:hypothetical protein
MGEVEQKADLRSGEIRQLKEAAVLESEAHRRDSFRGLSSVRLAIL